MRKIVVCRVEKRNDRLVWRIRRCFDSSLLRWQDRGDGLGAVHEREALPVVAHALGRAGGAEPSPGHLEQLGRERNRSQAADCHGPVGSRNPRGGDKARPADSSFYPLLFLEIL